MFTSEAYIFDITPSRHGGVWIRDNLGLVYATERTATHFLDYQQTDGAGPTLEDPSGHLWIPGDAFYRFDPATTNLTRLPGGERAPPTGSGCLNLHFLTNAILGFAAVGFEQGQLLLASNDVVHPLTPPFYSLGSRYMRSVLDARGDLWLSAGSNGLYRLRHGQFARVRLPWRTPIDFPVSSFADREGSLWIGTEFNGLYRVRPKPLHTLSKVDGLLHDNTWALQELPDGTLAIGSDGGLDLLGPGGQLLPSQPTLDATPFRGFLRALALDHDQLLWIGSSKGLYLRNATNQHEFVIDSQRQWGADGVGLNKIRTLVPRRDGGVWVGLADGLYLMQPHGGLFLNHRNGLPHLDIRAILEAPDHSLWLGTYGGGVIRLHPPLPTLESPSVPLFDDVPADARDHVARRYALPLALTHFTTTNGLASNIAFALHLDPEGLLWIATDRGLHRLDPNQRQNHDRQIKNQKSKIKNPITVFTRAHGLPDDQLNALVEDDFGDLWLTSDRGLARVARADLNRIADGHAQRAAAVSFDAADGMLSAETNGQKSHPSALKTRDGRLWFATTRGVVSVDPREIRRHELPPPILNIQRVVADNEILYDSRGPSAADEDSPHLPRAPSRLAPSPNSTLRLRPGRARVIEFQYTACTFVDAGQARFRYRLAGYETAWHDAGARRAAYYSNLPPGRYTFEVVGANHHKVWTVRPATFAFTLDPHYYQTAWFRLAALLALAALIYALLAWRVGETRRWAALQRELALQRERAHLARNLHDGLGADLSRLTLLADLAEREATTALPAATPHLHALRETARTVARSLRDTIWTTHTPDESLEATLHRLCQTAQSLLTPAGIACRFRLPEDLPPIKLNRPTRETLLFVAKESFNNAFKHSRATQFHIQAHLLQGTLELRLCDNGRGFDPGSLPSHPPTPSADGGIGLPSMRARVEDLRGAFALRTAPGAGTEIRITIPIPSARA